MFYAALQHAFINTFVVPACLVNPPNRDDLMLWNCNAGCSWSFSWTHSDPPVVSISSPPETGSKTLDSGEQLVFYRHFEGRLGRKGYFEILQRFVHLSDLHFLDERNSYCRLDKRGDIEEVIRITEVAEGEGRGGGSIITFMRGVLDQYLALTDSVLIRTYDFTRYRPMRFRGWSATPHVESVGDGTEFAYRIAVEAGNGSYLRGFQVVRPVLTKGSALATLACRAEEDRKYASFIAQDWKNKVVREISCAPGQTANYFTKSDLPFELSPAFFRPEVLLKYKADSEKYRLKDRSISCRGSWHLQTYDVNEVGQVHTYLVYLRDLPYQEQLHWKSHNEEPKGPISRRAFKTDFEGTWSTDYDPLDSLKNALSELKQREVPWWTLRSDELIEREHYPVTTSADEWANELLQLDQLVIEGFEERWLREKAKCLGRNPDVTNKSLKLLEECLIALGFETEHARSVMTSLFEAHHLRSKFKGHVSGNEATTIRKETLKKHGTYKKHFQSLCSALDESIRIIAAALGGLEGG